MDAKHRISTNYRDDIAALQELKWKAEAWEQYNLSQLLTDEGDLTGPLKVEFAATAPRGNVTSYSIAVVKALMILANVSALRVTSAFRSPEDQARVMFQNLEKGARIKYAAPGVAVTSKYDAAKRAHLGSDQTRKFMVNEIYRIGPEAVSKHASPPTWLNVVDIDPASMPAACRSKFIRSVNRLVGTYISRFLQPPKDPAFHIEIPQGRYIVSREAGYATSR